jgi:uncharacterized protein (DUF362 family)/NAD-dependent dihydropyrimidine dehydrogenase PreA subunit
MTSSKVALVHCENYEIENVREAVKRGLDLLGGAARFSKSGERILIKPNLLVGEPPQRAVSPHPAVFQAVLEQFKLTDAQLSFGDSPAVGTPQLAARMSGLLSVAEKLNVPVAEFQKSRTVSFPDGNLIKQFTLAAGVLDADGLISLCKMKSHALTKITGAVKNQFGCVPGVLKTEFHTSMSNATSFSKMLVDLNLFIKPRLYIMDGIIAMEGNGPRNGTPKSMRVILFSTDPIALDTVFCRLVNLNEKLVETIVFGEMYGLGSTDVEILGDPIADHISIDFQVNREKVISTVDQSPAFKTFMRNYVSPQPYIDGTKCKLCGKCEEVCPAQPKALTWGEGHKNPPVYDYGNCIRCFCCQELCPHEAISVKTPFLGRLIHR